jgi:hypothetical protein
MKQSRTTILILGVVFFLAARPAKAPSEETWPPLLLMGDVLADVSRVAEYEAALKDLISNLEKHGFPFRFDTYSTDDSHYYVIFGLKNYADVDQWNKAWADLGQKMGPANLQAVHGRIVAAEIERVYIFWRFRPDISFLPEKERLKPEEIGFYTWDYVWVIPGKEAEFEAVNKEWIALSEAKKVRDPFMTYMGDLGTTMPVWKAMGEEGAALSKKTRALIRRIESKTGRYRPDLSYAPKTK